MECHECGATISDKAADCPHCGASVSDLSGGAESGEPAGDQGSGEADGTATGETETQREDPVSGGTDEEGPDRPGPTVPGGDESPGESPEPGASGPPDADSTGGPDDTASKNREQGGASTESGASTETETGAEAGTGTGGGPGTETGGEAGTRTETETGWEAAGPPPDEQGGDTGVDPDVGDQETDVGDQETTIGDQETAVGDDEPTVGGASDLGSQETGVGGGSGFGEETDTTYSFQTDSEENTGGGDSFPSRLKEFDQWLVTHDTPWNDERNKSPRYPEKGWNDGNLIPFEDAYRRSRGTDNAGIAFCFTEDGPFIGFDLDDVKRDGEFSDEALAIIEQLASYTEVSSSGDGLHVIAEGERAANREHRADLSEQGHIEVYEKDRYFVLTGDVYEGYSTVEKRSTAVRVVQEDHLPKDTSWSFEQQQMPSNGQQSGEEQTDTTPEQVRRTIEAYAGNDTTSVDRTVLRLWDGSDCGHPSPSEADLEFAAHLYFWCKGDQQLMDECFRASGRMREKWDEVHSSDGETYGEMTIAKACRTNEETFGGSYVK